MQLREVGFHYYDSLKSFSTLHQGSALDPLGACAAPKRPAKKIVPVPLTSLHTHEFTSRYATDVELFLEVQTLTYI